MASTVPLSFSPNDEICAYSNPDGTLKLWECETGSLKQEYVPSSHLSATCSCICWGPKRATESPRKKKKKRKSDVSETVNNLDLIALGTTSGSLLLYSYTKGELHTQLNDGHTDRVNGVCWHPSGEVLYSCSSDRHIVEWEIATSTVKHKWKADKSSVNSIALGPTETQLLSAGRTIKLWDLVKQELLQTFTGHPSEVIQLLPVPNYISGASAQNGSVDRDQRLSSYFLSAAAGDRLIHAWQTTRTDKNSLVSFALPDEPNQIYISPYLHDQMVLLGATTKSGQVLVFEHVLNGRVKKPLQPKVMLQIATETEDIPSPIPILGAQFCNTVEAAVLFAHGIFLKPVFEKVAYNKLDCNTCLLRKDPRKTVLNVEASASKVKTPDVSSNLTVLAPGHMVPSAPTVSGEPAKKKKVPTATLR